MSHDFPNRSLRAARRPECFGRAARLHLAISRAPSRAAAAVLGRVRIELLPCGITAPCPAAQRPAADQLREEFRQPIPGVRGDGTAQQCVRERTPPLTDAAAGIRVLKVLQACQISLQLNGRPVLLSEIQ